MAFHTQFRGSCRGLARMVGLRSALRDNRIGLVLLRVGHQEFEFAGLVTTGRKTGTVIALDP